MTNKAPSAKPILMWIKPDDLHINEKYQRAVSTKRGMAVIKNIAEKFDWALFLPIAVTRREEGGYWVIDGQHRVLAARRIPLDEVPAVVLDIKGTRAQACAFVGINAQRVNMHALAIHHAMVSAGDELAVRLHKCCEIAGVSIPRYPKQVTIMKPHETLSVANLKSAMKIHGDDALIWALRILRAAYPNEAGYISGGYIRVLASFYSRHADHPIHEDTVIMLVGENMVTDFFDEEQSSVPRITAAVQGLTERYNQERPQGKRALPEYLQEREIA